MKKKTKIIQLDCGINAETWEYSGDQYMEISLIDLYDGYGELNSLLLLSKLFAELATKGFTSNGLSTVEGYSGSTDDLLLRVHRRVV